jgi:organic hydroperoxide reductase OsmC/OhrA
MAHEISVTVTQQSDFRFLIDFAGIAALQADEGPPLGKGEGPTPNHLLAAAVGNCLSASLLFALRKYKQDPGGITTTVTCTIDRNERGRLRVQRIAVDIRLGRAAAEVAHLDRAVQQFEDFCTVTQSVRAGIAIGVRVFDAGGTVVHAAGTASHAA